MFGSTVRRSRITAERSARSLRPRPSRPSARKASRSSFKAIAIICPSQEFMARLLLVSVSVIEAVREPGLAPPVAEDPVEAAVGELDVPVIALDRIVRPPAFLERPWAGGHAHRALDLDGGAGWGFDGDEADGKAPLTPALSRGGVPLT